MFDGPRSEPYVSRSLGVVGVGLFHVCCAFCSGAAVDAGVCCTEGAFFFTAEVFPCPPTIVSRVSPCWHTTTPPRIQPKARGLPSYAEPAPPRYQPAGAGDVAVAAPQKMKGAIGSLVKGVQGGVEKLKEMW